MAPEVYYLHTARTLNQSSLYALLTEPYCRMQFALNMALSSTSGVPSAHNVTGLVDGRV
jgi:hypothetical protein